MPYRDATPICWEIRKHFRELLVIAQFSIAHQQHDRHGGELLGERCQSKVRFRINLRYCPQIANPVAAPEHYTSVFLDKNGEPRRPVIRKRREDGIEPGPGCFARPRYTDPKQNE